ncbi:DsbA family protein [Sphingobium sp. BYY-5]|uniref:DsbA family protein n=1 Tax=Sphingobium sp. BYY-5 TaxID=2926400 RepID=UPI001FA7A039|nr:DsbA family protein [Sphingobium sp. BYY-5]MCI4591429.1 DsbA family protein [Sphingobium sp. BYY-5]
MTDQTRPDFRAALSNRTMQMTLGAFAFIAAAAGTALAVQAAPASVNATDKAAIEKIVHDYILDHPEIIPQAIEKLQAKRVSSTIEASRSALETPYAGAWEGAANADVTVVEFFDYACGYCRASLPDLAKLVGSDAKVKVVYRELPILSEASGDAAKVSLLAAERGQYMAYHKALYGAGKVTRDTIIAAAAKAGITKSEAESAIASSKYDAEIQSNIALAQKLQATGTPTFVIGGQVLSGAVGYDTLKEGVAAARGK